MRLQRASPHEQKLWLKLHAATRPKPYKERKLFKNTTPAFVQRPRFGFLLCGEEFFDWCGLLEAILLTIILALRMALLLYL